MKLALVSAKFPFGGKEPYLHAELRALAPYFERIVVFPTSPSERQRGFAEVAAEVERRGLFGLDTLGDAVSALVTRPRQSIAAVAALLRGSPRREIALKNLAVVPLGLSLGFRLRRDGFDHVHSYWLSTPASVAFVAARVAGIPWSSTGHLWDIYEDNALAVKLPDARFVRAISVRGRRDLLATPGCAAADVQVIHVGVDVPPAAREPGAEPPAARPFALLCAANLVPKKGHADLLEALAELRDRGVALRCTIAGDGQLRDALHAQADALGLGDTVIFRGHVAHATLLDEMRAGAYDAMALTSLELPGGLMEGIPVALMEAMALGLPVIATDTGSIAELVDDECGRLVDQRNVTAIAAALAELAAEPHLRDELARAAYDKVRAEFNVVQVARELAGLIGAAP